MHRPTWRWRVREIILCVDSFRAAGWLTTEEWWPLYVDCENARRYGMTPPDLVRRWRAALPELCPHLPDVAYRHPCRLWRRLAAALEEVSRDGTPG